MIETSYYDEFYFEFNVIDKMMNDVEDRDLNILYDSLIENLYINKGHLYSVLDVLYDIKVRIKFLLNPSPLLLTRSLP